VLEVELDHPVLAAGVEVDRPRVALVEGAHAVDRADHAVALASTIGRWRRCRAARRRDAAAPGACEERRRRRASRSSWRRAGRLDLGAWRPGRGVAPPAASGISAAAQGRCLSGHRLVAGVDDQRLAGPRDQLLGVVEEVLVEGVGQRDQGGERLAPGPPHPPRALPGGHHAPRVADQDAGVEAADVDPHLQRRGRDHPLQPAGEELASIAAAPREETAR
jgi:hypothetical protein